MKPRPRDTEQSYDPDTVAEFCALLLTALEIPEVQAAVRRLITPPPAPRPVPVRGRGGRRG